MTLLEKLSKKTEVAEEVIIIPQHNTVRRIALIIDGDMEKVKDITETDCIDRTVCKILAGKLVENIYNNPDALEKTTLTLALRNLTGKVYSYVTYNTTPLYKLAVLTANDMSAYFLNQTKFNMQKRQTETQQNIPALCQLSSQCLIMAQHYSRCFTKVERRLSSIDTSTPLKELVYLGASNIYRSFIRDEARQRDVDAVISETQYTNDAVMIYTALKFIQDCIAIKLSGKKQQ